MLDAIKPLLDSGLINESTQQALNEAWEAKLSEAREQVRADAGNDCSGSTDRHNFKRPGPAPQLTSYGEHQKRNGRVVNHEHTLS